MATFRPTTEHFDELLDPLDDATLEVVARLSELTDDWTVYVRPHVGQDVPAFIAVHDRCGVCVIEIAKSSADSEQAVSVARRHRSTIYDHCLAFPGDPRDPGPAIRGVVVVPFCTTAEAAARTTTGLTDPGQAVAIIGGNDLVGHLGAPPVGPSPTPAAISRLHHDVVVPGMVHDSVVPVQLSSNARLVAANPRSARVRGVTGPAGTGKTFALTARAARLAAEGKSVLVLCFNLTLADRLRLLVVERCAEYGADPTRVTCTSFHTFCSRVVDDATRAGIVPAEPTRGTWPVKIVAKTTEVLERGFDRHFDAVLVDEGQDFTLDWWNLLRRHVVRPDGEMLLACDPMVDLGGKHTWTDDTVSAAGFDEPWIEMASTYRVGPTLVESMNLFADAFLPDEGVVPEVPDDQVAVVGRVSASVRAWRNVERVADLGAEMGRQVVRLLTVNPALSPRDIVYLCEYHHDGLAAAEVIEEAGYPVHHVYSRDPDARHERKRRFWPGADAVKGCTVHSFKGWESPVVVLGIGVEERSRRLAYASMTRVSATHGLDQAHLVVVNADPRLADFRPTFELGAPLSAVV